RKEADAFNHLSRKIDFEYCKSKKFVFILFGILAGVSIILAHHTISMHPLNINQSDIIPFIDEVFVKRFMNGDYVYANYTGFNYGTFTPGYLPFHWGPFLLIKLVNLNYQWVSTIAFLLACVIYLFYLIKNIQNKWMLLINVTLPFLVLFLIYLKSGGSGVQSIEVMVMAYYLLLSISIFSKNVFFKSLGVVMPLLSRYSFLFWIPVYFFNLLKSNLKTFLLVSLIVTSLVLLFFVIPFVLPSPEILLKMNANYITSTVEEWNGQSWQTPSDRPFQLFQGIGFASWFYEFGSGSLVSKIELTKTFLFVISVMAMLLLLLFYKKIRETIDKDLFSLLTLKLMLTLFYALIMIPYDYLNWVPLILSIVILSRINYSYKS
ncbi:MAG: hypothetical protein WCK82_04615, partial [Bacteroidota bacterium]